MIWNMQRAAIIFRVPDPLLHIGIPLIVKYQAHRNAIQKYTDKQRKIV